MSHLSRTAAGLRGIALVVVLACAACASAPDPANEEAYADYQARNDPLEPFNRGVYQVNRGIDALILKPAAGWYRLLTPPFMQDGVTNFLRNLRTPVILINDLLQGEWARAGDTSLRFLVNTTLGVGGLRDPATDFGIERHDEDFGQTLAVWGTPEPFFLMLPVLGPSNPRDAAGIAVDGLLLDPIGYYSWSEGGTWTPVSRSKTGATAIDARSRNWDAFEDIEKNSLDPYAAWRSLYRQYRAKEINQGRAEETPEFPTFEEIPDIPDIPEAEEPPAPTLTR